MLITLFQHSIIMFGFKKVQIRSRYWEPLSSRDHSRIFLYLRLPAILKDSLRHKLDVLAERRRTLNEQLSDSEVVQNSDRLRELSIELSEISEVVQQYNAYTSFEAQIEETRLLLEDDDPQMRSMAETEISELEQSMQNSLDELQRLLLPKDPNDSRNIFLEIRAGTGGDEAAIFAGNLYRMYKLYVQNQGWKSETVSQHEGEYGGYREVILRVIGKGAYSRLKFESGTHRVQRVPKTETQGRIHTSACTVAILPEADKIDDVEVKSTGFEGGHLSSVRGGRAACQSNRFGGSNHTSALWNRSRMSGRTVAAPESGESNGSSSCTTSSDGAAEAARTTNRGA